MEYVGNCGRTMAVEPCRWEIARQALQMAKQGASCQSLHRSPCEPYYGSLHTKWILCVGLLISNEDFWNFLIPRINCQAAQDLQLGHFQERKLKKLPLPLAVWREISSQIKLEKQPRKFLWNCFSLTSSPLCYGLDEKTSHWLSAWISAAALEWPAHQQKQCQQEGESCRAEWLNQSMLL